MPFPIKITSHQTFSPAVVMKKDQETMKPPGGNGDLAVLLPGEHDVLLGRGAASWGHSGNRSFRDIVATYLNAYDSARLRIEKTTIVSEIIDRVEKTGGRFLKRDTITEQWAVVDRKQAVEKVGHAIRDKKAVEMKKRNTGKMALAMRRPIKKRVSMQPPTFKSLTALQSLPSMSRHQNDPRLSFSQSMFHKFNSTSGDHNGITKLSDFVSQPPPQSVGRVTPPQHTNFLGTRGRVPLIPTLSASSRSLPPRNLRLPPRVSRYVSSNQQLEDDLLMLAGRNFAAASKVLRHLTDSREAMERERLAEEATSSLMALASLSQLVDKRFPY